MGHEKREPLLGRPPGGQDAQKVEEPITLPGASARWWRKMRLAMYTVFLLVSSLGNAVYFKRMTDAMPNYSWYLGQLSIVAYIPFFGILAGRASTKLDLGLVNKFLLMGVFDGLGGTLTVLGGVHTSGTNQVLLQQAVIPITMLLSVAVIGKRFHSMQYLGAAAIVGGLVFAKLLLPSGADDDSGGAADLPFFNVLFLLALVPAAASSVFKEVAFRNCDGDLDVNVLQFWVAAFQFMVNFVAMPIYTLELLGPQKVELRDMPGLTYGGSRCLFFLEDQITVDCGLPGQRPCDHCQDAWVPVLGYMIFNLAYNVCTMMVIKHGSAALSFLVATLRMPLSALAFSSPMVMGAEARPPSEGDMLSLVVIIIGLGFYRQGGQFLKRQAKAEQAALRANGVSPGLMSPTEPAGPQFASPASSTVSPGGEESASSGRLGRRRGRRFVPLFSTTGLPGVQPVFACVPAAPRPQPRSAERVRSDLYRRLGTASPLQSPRLRKVSFPDGKPGDAPTGAGDGVRPSQGARPHANSTDADFHLLGFDAAAEGTSPPAQTSSA